eukprot:CAMPEP_0185583146 /NCGR_PEP_ID=MMETSP0434-20130131/21349_1 /TAXON_ID=626734 ORGANISM="Favella taraikaensis, Strain Fe Narragansett Bay" /NCGR_SAMPLE_ID=MMETSP0434 /ASSEMBLY_ACC=CAM_ASM_000379 /LENGTH=103 /DNA_ID=CAMNT_0028202155 /DNA_START=22 /DNA_END=333 /DNA_ORIENTATION=+
MSGAARKLATFSASRVWFGHSETYPVIACIGVAVAWCGWVSTSYLTSSPDVQWTKTSRGSTIRDNTAEGSAWVSHKAKWIDTNVSEIAVTRGLSAKYPGGRKQ